MGFHNRPRYAFPISATVHNPLASTTYYFSNLPSPPGTGAGALNRLYIPLASTLLIVGVHYLCSTLGSSEQGAIYLRVNDTTDYTISATAEWDAALAVAASGVLGLPLVETELTEADFIQIKVVTPAWVTAPTGVVYWGWMQFGSSLY